MFKTLLYEKLVFNFILRLVFGRAYLSFYENRYTHFHQLYDNSHRDRNVKMFAMVFVHSVQLSDCCLMYDYFVGQAECSFLLNCKR